MAKKGYYVLRGFAAETEKGEHKFFGRESDLSELSDATLNKHVKAGNLAEGDVAEVFSAPEPEETTTARKRGGGK
jgi:hypothetical protein